MTTLTSPLVLGPTGGFGQFLLAELIRRKGEFHRIGAFNDLSRPAGESKQKQFALWQAQGVEIVSGTISDPNVYAGFDVLILPLGNHAIKLQPSIIDTAIQAGVRHFYPSEFGADLTVDGNWQERYYRDKVLTRQHLEERAKEIEGLGWTYFMNGRFAEWAIIPHFGVYVHEGRATIVVGPSGSKGIQSLLGVGDAAKYLIATLLSPLPPVRNPARAYRFVGGNYSWIDIFSTLEKIQGIKYQITYTDVEEARARQKQAIEAGDVDKELEASHQVIQGTGRTLLPKPYDNDKFPEIVPEPLETSLRRVFEEKEKFPTLGL